MLDLITITSYGVCTLAYLALSVVLVTAKWRASPKTWLVLAGCLATATWSGVVTATSIWEWPDLPGDLAEGLRNILWLLLLLKLITHEEIQPERIRRLPLGNLLPYLVVVIAASSVAPTLWPVPLVGTGRECVQIIVPVLELLALENLIRNGNTAERWGLKHLCLGLGAVFAYDFFLHADALLLRQEAADFVAARGMVTALAAPLLAISLMRSKSWERIEGTSLNFSHRGAFHSAALLGSGLYLLVMAALAYYIRGIGGQWGGALQITFMIGGLLLLVVVFASGRLKSEARILVQKYFFTYKYDYREEWMRFVSAVSSRHPLSLSERLLRAIATMMDSPAGALWVWRRQDEAYCPDAAWNYHGARPSEPPGTPLIAFFERKNWIIEIDEFRKWPERYEGLALPAFIAEYEQAWLIVPFVHREDVLGFLVLDRARAPRRLDWEDRDLLKTTAAHAAGYLAEEIAADALSEAQKLEDFNRRFAFVAHDIKNVVGQMGLLVDNAERFGDNPEFQKDMLDTVRNAVARLRTLMGQLAAKRQPTSCLQPVDLKALTEEAAQRWRKTNPKLLTKLPPSPVLALAIKDDLVSVLDFLIDNAIGAAGPDGAVCIALQSRDEQAIMEVQDNGPGMDSAFIRNELFRPLKSTKSFGYGIGAYQTRHLVRAMGGQLEVDSVLEEGTTMRILLPGIHEGAKTESRSGAVT